MSVCERVWDCVRNESAYYSTHDQQSRGVNAQELDPDSTSYG